MKLKINDTHYTTKYHPTNCIGCVFEEDGSGVCEKMHLLNDMCIAKDIIYTKGQITEVLNYENSISR
jgi:hypothetical protein